MYNIWRFSLILIANILEYVIYMFLVVFISMRMAKGKIDIFVCFYLNKLLHSLTVYYKTLMILGMKMQINNIFLPQLIRYFITFWSFRHDLNINHTLDCMTA